MSFGQIALAWLLIGVCLLLMLVILLQRGRGGGLAGAFGGGGGSSAFGAKTGDVFTWITVALAGLFILLAVVANFVFEPSVLAVPTTAELTPAPPADTSVPSPVTVPLGKGQGIGKIELLTKDGKVIPVGKDGKVLPMETKTVAPAGKAKTGQNSEPQGDSTKSEEGTGAGQKPEKTGGGDSTSGGTGNEDPGKE